MKKIIPLLSVAMLMLVQSSFASQTTYTINVSCTIPVIIGVNYFPNEIKDIALNESTQTEGQPIIDKFFDKINLDGQMVNIQTIIMR